MRNPTVPRRGMVAGACAFLLVVTGVFVFSCQKNNTGQPEPSALQAQVERWLDEQKPANKPNKSAMVDLLKKNLRLSESRREALNEAETFLVIPVEDDYNQQRKWDEHSLTILVLVTDKSGEIIRGNLMQWIPPANENGLAVPKGTLYKIYHYEDLECSGEFTFYSVPGRALYRLQYVDGKFHSMSVVRTKAPADMTVSTGGRERACTEWYWVTRLYINGELVDEKWEYVTTTCDYSGSCDDPFNMSFCPDDSFGSGGGSTGDINCCITDPNFQYVVTSASQVLQDPCEPETIDPATGNPIKTCVRIWEFASSKLAFYGWGFTSTDVAVLEKINGIWYFRSITHQSVNRTGIMPLCVTEKMNATPVITISGDKLVGRITIYYGTELIISCIKSTSGGGLGRSGFGSTIWYAA